MNPFESKAELIRSLRGKYSHIQTSSDKFAQSKQEEIDWEDKSAETKAEDRNTFDNLLSKPFQYLNPLEPVALDEWEVLQ
jgi:hypothetical protein